MSKLELFSYFRSSCSFRVRIALNLKGLPYTYKAVHLRKGEQKSEAFSKVNPNQTVPVLVVDGEHISQSLAIIEYLEETHPTPPLYPRDPIKRARARALALIIGADIQPLQNLRVLNTVSTRQEEKNAHARAVITEGFGRLEKALQETAGKYSVGDEVTVADLFLVPQVSNAVRFEVDMSKYPLIQRINQECLKLEAFQKAAPEVQPDAEL